MPDLFLFAVEDVIKIDGLAGHVLLPGISCGENMPDIAPQLGATADECATNLKGRGKSASWRTTRV